MQEHMNQNIPTSCFVGVQNGAQVINQRVVREKDREKYGKWGKINMQSLIARK